MLDRRIHETSKEGERAVSPLYITAFTAVSALGAGCGPHRDAFLAGRSALDSNDFEIAPGVAPLAGFVGRVRDLEGMAFPPSLAAFDCRNHRLALQGLRADDFDAAVRRARERHGARRIAVIVGASTSGILSTELAYRERDAAGGLRSWLSYEHTHSFGALAGFVRGQLALEGPALAISTACSSSAKVFATAARWTASGACDAAVVGGVDSLCGTTIYGFNSLQLVSRHRCRPFDAERDGISLGEGAAFALVERSARGGLALLGYGESADAHHMSAPHPEGLGARLAMRAALERAGNAATRIAFVNAHGTATRNNDTVEAGAVRAELGAAMPATSIKGYLGHTLGAAGAIGAVASLLAIEHGFIPGTVNSSQVETDCPVPVPLATLRRPVAAVISNSFGFGGNNASLVFGAV